MQWVLQRQFGSSFSALEAGELNNTLLDSDLEGFLTLNHQIKAVSSLGLRLPLSSSSRHKFITGLFQRPPLEGIFGIYEAERRQFGVSKEDVHYRSLHSYIKSKISQGSNFFKDAQTNFIGDGGTYYEAPAWILLIEPQWRLTGWIFVV
jgi:hypothetical protein